jgi:hypothetical protein
MKLNTKKFKQLLETKQGDVKPFVSEQVETPPIPAGPTSSQNPNSLMVNGQDLNTTVKMFELYSAKKPFTNKECFYIDSGNNNFKPQNYDVTKNQAIFDKDGKKFEKGENMRLAQYLDDAGWVEAGTRQTTQGDVPVTVVRYKKK